MKEFLDQHFEYYAKHFNCELDPISIPKKFQLKQDIEISGFFAAILAWGNRKAILKSANDLMSIMDNAPYQFILEHKDADLKRLEKFYYRTFQATDVLFFVSFLQQHYQSFASLESAFFKHKAATVYDGLLHFYDYCFSLPYAPQRSKKHIGNVAVGSACKRLNMFLRWMVRKDNIDFGIWNAVKPNQLICPLDVHSGQVARNLGLLSRKQNDWKSAILLTDQLKKYDGDDPIKYDLVLFSLGVEKVKY